LGEGKDVIEIKMAKKTNTFIGYLGEPSFSPPEASAYAKVKALVLVVEPKSVFLLAKIILLVQPIF